MAYVCRNDVIDEINERDRIRRSIVKSWNVNYVPQGYQEAAALGLAGDAAVQGMAGDAAGQAASGAEKPVVDHASHLPTGIYCESYEDMDEQDQGQVEKILNEKEAAIRGIVEHGG